MYDDGFKEEINNVYSKSLEDIQFFKQQQWKVVYYCLLLFGALFYLIGFFVYDKDNPLFDYKTDLQWILAIVSFVITSFGLYFQIDFQNQMEKNRIRIRKIRYKYFRGETLNLFDLADKKKVEKHGSFWRGGEYLAIFYFTILVAFGLFIFMIYESIWLVIALVFILFFAPMNIYKSEGINLLSTVCGFTLVLLWIILLFSTVGGSDIMSWGGSEWIIFLIITSLLAYFLGWGIIRLPYLVYCGLRKIKKNKMEGAR